MHHLSLRSRIHSIVLIFTGSILLAGVVDVVMLRNALQQEKEVAIRQLVESAHGVLAHYARLEANGTLSRSSAQAAAMSSIRAMRYNGDNYFWINDDQVPARMLMHPIIPALEGQPLLGERYNRATAVRTGTTGPFVSTDGLTNLTEAFAAATAQQGHGYVTYMWERNQQPDGAGGPALPKLSYVKRFDGWGWTVGSGIFVDDIDAIVYRQATWNLLILLGIGGALLLLAAVIARGITRPLQATMQTMREIAADPAGLSQRVPVDGPSEIAELAGNFNAMLDHVQARDRALHEHGEKLEQQVASRTASLLEANQRLDAELKERKRQEAELQANLAQVRQLNQQLAEAQSQLLQAEKMASIGQLAAGVAHEINNPIGFVTSNLGTLGKYAERLVKFQSELSQLLIQHAPPEAIKKLDTLRADLRIDHVVKDISSLVAESLDGTNRVARIVSDLKVFSRTDHEDLKRSDLNACIETAINIVWNELKYKVELIREFSQLPEIDCYPQKLSQVFMNLLVNASHAIDKQGRITVATRSDGTSATITIADTGCGIEESHRARIFEPFFTTKEVGKGTGLGLSISYDIIKKHGGEITVQSEVGKGTIFTIEL